MRIFAGWAQKACGLPIDTAAQSRSGEDRGGDMQLILMLFSIVVLAHGNRPMSGHSRRLFAGHGGSDVDTINE